MRIYKFLIAFCILWFIFLCLLHYFSARPLWLDEGSILENIKGFNFSEILGPIKNSQAFPRIYLIAIKYLSGKFNYTVLSLRFLPLIMMLFAFLVWAKLYNREFSHRRHFFTALFSFASSYYLSYYASELKQYSLEVLVVGLFCLYLNYQKHYLGKELPKSFILTTLVLPFTLFLTYSSFFVFWIVIYNFLFFAKKNPKVLSLLIIYVLFSLCAIISVLSFDIKHTLATQPLFSYWKDYFLCTDSFYCFMKSFSEGLRRLSVWWFGNTAFFRRAASFFIPFFLAALFSYGIKSLAKNKFKLWEIDAVGLTIFLELFILGLIKKYPFTGERITLFFAPFVFYFIVKGINSLNKYKSLYLDLGFNTFYLAFLVLCSINSLLIYLKLYV